MRCTRCQALSSCPIFALANAGVRIERDALEAPGAGRVTLAVVVGLVLGKTLGILGLDLARGAVGPRSPPRGFHLELRSPG